MMLKHTHMLLAILSISLFTLRFAWVLTNSDLMQRKWVKIAPHIIDTLLLTIGIIMSVKLHLNPAEQLWLAEKLFAIVAYIFTGYYTLKLARNKAMRIIGYLGAMGWVMLVVRLAMTKESIIF